MSEFVPPVSHCVRRKPIAACIASLFALSAHAAMASSTWPVTSCDDNAAGSLRDVVGAATTVTGDIVDMTSLTCINSTISLTTGEIVVHQDSLTIQGPGSASLGITAIDNNVLGQSRIFRHTGAGSLIVQGLGLRDATLTPVPGNGAYGGCITSAGTVRLYSVDVRNCTAYATSVAWAEGGAIFAVGGVALKYSTLTGNTASSVQGYSIGGAVKALGGMFIKSSTIDNNKAKSLGGPYKGVGGAIASYGSTYMVRSTISNNYSSGDFGAIFQTNRLASPAASNYLKVFSSTISGNHAKTVVGGIETNAGTVQLYNSTIAFNTATQGSLASGPDLLYFSPGLTITGYDTAVAVTLQSSVLSNNTYGSSETDISTINTASPGHAVTFNAGPANNLIRTSHAAGLPGDTLTTCPLLGPLRDNGGLTRTHALLSHSPAIDHGSNVRVEAFDQRGQASDPFPYPYPRLSNLVADIGAYEVNQDDVLFNTAFDGCPI